MFKLDNIPETFIFGQQKSVIWQAYMGMCLNFFLTVLMSDEWQIVTFF